MVELVVEGQDLEQDVEQEDLVEEQEDLVDHCILISTDHVVLIYRPIFEEDHQEVVSVDSLEAMVLMGHHWDSHP